MLVCPLDVTTQDVPRPVVCDLGIPVPAGTMTIPTIMMMVSVTIFSWFLFPWPFIHTHVGPNPPLSPISPPGSVTHHNASELSRVILLSGRHWCCFVICTFGRQPRRRHTTEPESLTGWKTKGEWVQVKWQFWQAIWQEMELGMLLISTATVMYGNQCGSIYCIAI